MRVLRRSLTVQILPGVVKEGGDPIVWFKLKNPKLPTGGIAFALTVPEARAFAGQIERAARGDLEEWQVSEAEVEADDFGNTGGESP